MLSDWGDTINFCAVRKDGYTLFETLVAMMVLAISITVILQLFSGGLKAAKISNDYSKAVLFAQEKMEETLLLPVLSEGIIEGEHSNSYIWQVEIIMLSNSKDALNLKRAFKIIVKVLWQSGFSKKSVALETISLAALGETTSDDN
jgi:general secretion pathway protein I